MITIVDYGAGNLRSVGNALDRLGLSYRLIACGDELSIAERILFPGVGHFGAMMRALEERGLREALLACVERDVPLLGICLGMQALFEESEEAPGTPGLGLIEGLVRRFDSGLVVPHMGWNLVRGASGSDWFYFANSYYAPVLPVTTSVAEYGGDFSAEVKIGAISGIQYHPEKSGEAGLRRLARWCEDAG